ncbi:MAG: HNH endonuclease [Pseudomonadota bacterium]
MLEVHADRLGSVTDVVGPALGQVVEQCTYSTYRNANTELDPTQCIVAEVFRLQGKCPVCGRAMRFKTPRTGPRGDCFSLDHRKRQRDGGSDDWPNLDGKCISCNSRSG